MVAIVFGVISPNRRIIRVRAPLAIATIELPKLYARLVVRDAADRFTMLLPIRMALNILPESSVIFNTVLALFLPSSARLRIRILFTVVNAVSADEKKADSINSTIRIIICVTSLESNDKSTPF